MSYTFSRRDFMKYTAVAAVAVAGSSMFTGCSFSNPNQPTGTVGSRLKVVGYHTLSAVEKTDGVATYTFTFKHEPNSDIKIQQGAYSIVIDSKEYRYTDVGQGTISAFALGDGESKGNLESGKTATVHLKITFNENSTVTDASSVKVRYWPREYALGSSIDSYNNVFATWDCTAKIKELNSSSSTTEDQD